MTLGKVSFESKFILEYLSLSWFSYWSIFYQGIKLVQNWYGKVVKMPASGTQPADQEWGKNYGIEKR